MNSKVFKTLEFFKILDLLAEHADSLPARSKCLDLRPVYDIDKINKDLDHTNSALSRVYARGKVSFTGIVDIRPLLKRLDAGGSLNSGELLSVKTLLEAASRVQNYYPENSDSLTSIIDELDAVPELASAINRCILSENEISDNASPSLRSIRKEKENFKARIQSELNSMLNSLSIRNCLQDPIITMRGDRYCLPVKAEYRSRVPGIVHDRSSTGSTLFIEPSAVVALNGELKQIEIRENEEIEKILKELSEKAAEYHHPLFVNSRNLAELDFIFAKADFAKDLRAERPIINDKNRIVLKQARHPLIARDKVVPIDFSIGDDYSLLIITGPNTGGKTVTLKTVGLLTLMAQSGLNIPADEHSEIACFREVFADIGDEQSIEQSLSTFSSHMTNIARILKQADHDCLLLFDELGAGTDPTEGAALAVSILNSLREKKITTLATTHYSELKVYALTTDGVENAGCEFDINTLRPTYHLLIGVPGRSNAFAISRKLGLSDELIEDAGRRLSDNEIKFEDLISDLDQARRTAVKEKDEIENYKKEISRLKSEIEEQNRKTQASKDKILSNANEEAARILSNAKKYADKAVKTMNKSGITLDELEKQREELRKKAEDKKEKIIVKQVPKRGKNTYTPEDFNPGVKVHVLSMDVDGEVATRPDSKGDLTVLIGSFKTKINIKELEIDDTKPVKEKLRPGLTGQSYGSRSASSLRVNKTSKVSPEINLLGMYVDEAVSVLDKYLDDVYLSGLSQVRIVHGKGTGALRKGIRSYLDSNPVIKDHHLGSEGEGGDGVTIATFK